MALEALAREKQVKDIVALLLKRPITEEIALRVDACAGFETLDIVAGEWVGLFRDEDETVSGEEQGTIEFRLLLAIGNYVMAHRLGRVYPGDTNFVLEGVPGNILYRCRPDVAFVPQQNVRKTQGYIFGVPALAVEIISPREEAAAIRGKLEAYLRYGVAQVWHIYPSLQTLIIYLPDGTARTCKADETVTGGDVLPGFSLKLSELFED